MSSSKGAGDVGKVRIEKARSETLSAVYSRVGPEIKSKEKMTGCQGWVLPIRGMRCNCGGFKSGGSLLIPTTFFASLSAELTPT